MDSPSDDVPGMLALVTAVLERALDDVRMGGHLAVQAIEWLTERESGDAWSFEWCCSILKLDAGAVRRQVSSSSRARHAA